MSPFLSSGEVRLATPKPVTPPQRRTGMTTRTLCALAISASSLLEPVCVAAQAPHQDAAKLEIGSPPPPISAVHWYNTDSPVDLASLRGKLVLVDFWGLWCTPCREELPKLADLQRRFAERGLVIVGVHTPQKAEQLPDFLRKNNVHMLVAVDSGKTAESYGVSAFPTYVLIDRTGAVLSFPEAPPTVEVIERLLSQKP